MWLVKTSPVHVKQWGTFVRSQIQGDDATLSIRTEVKNDDKTAQSTRVVSKILDPSGKEIGNAATRRTVDSARERADVRTEDISEAAFACGRSRREISTSWLQR